MRSAIPDTIAAMSTAFDGTNIRLYSRGEWGARAPGPMTSQLSPREAFLHHCTMPDAEHLTRLTEQTARVREIQSLHFARGFSEIGYHYIVAQPYGSLSYARVFQGRDHRYAPAAQANHNAGTLAICVLGDFRSDTVKRSTRYAIEVLLRHHPSVKRVGGHRDVVATECPGDRLYAQLDRIAAAAGVKVYRP